MTAPPEPLAALTGGASELGLALSTCDCEKMLGFLALLQKWNRTHNLTAIRDIDAMVGRHLLDSLSIHEFIDDGRVLDVGSGAGLPGIPLAIAKPHVMVTLLDSVQKKTRFQQFAIAQLGLANVDAVHARVEQLTPPPAFDFIIARAFSAAEKLLRLAGHMLAEDGAVLAMTAATDYRLGDVLDSGFRVADRKKLRVPGDNAERNIVIFKRIEIESGR